MRVGRLILVVATLVTIMVFPLVVRDALRALNLPSAYAAANVLDPAGRAYQNGNFNNDDDDEDDNNENNDESDNEGEDNDNAVECYLNLNDNEPVPCDFEDNDNDVVYSPPAAAPAPAPAPGSQPAQRNCFDAGETGDLQLNLEGGSVTVRVVPPAGLPSSARIDLDDIDDMSTIPAPPSGATMLDRLVWRIDATAPCDGPGVGQLPGAVNLAIRYHVPADKSKLQIVMLENGVWEEVQTVPDPNPNNPYISATIQETGVYAVIQEP